MGGEFFQCIKQRSFDHKKAGGVKERFAAVIKGTPSPPQEGEPAAKRLAPCRSKRHVGSMWI